MKKKKLFSVLLALVLVLSFSLVTAVPVAADDQESSGWAMATPTVTTVTPNEGDQGATLASVVITGTGFAQGPENVGKWQPAGPTTGTVEYSTAQVKSGTYSMHLEAFVASSPGDANEVYIGGPTGILTLNDLADVTFWYYCPAGQNAVAPLIDVWLDLDGNYDRAMPCTGDDEWLLGMLADVTEFDTWMQVTADDIEWVRATGGTVYGTGAAGLVNAKAEAESGSYATLGDCPLLAVGVETGGPGTYISSRSYDMDFYVEDIAINGTNYALEPTETAATTGGLVSFGPDITVNSYSVDSASQITAAIDIDGAATPGTRNVAVHLLSAGTGTGTGVFTVNEPPFITVMAPSAIDLGLMKKGADNLGSATPGSVDTNQTIYSVTAMDNKSVNPGKMVSGTNIALTSKFLISKDGSTYADADTGITYDSVATLPFFVKQYVDNADAAGSYKITITFIGTY